MPMETLLVIWTYVAFALGFVLLIKGADWLVDGASSIARKLKMSDIAIGLTIVSFGTSAPELVVNIIASFEGNADLAVGNILGSNIANVLLILGIASLIAPLTVQGNTVWKEIPLSVLAVLVLAALANDSIIDGYGESKLGRGDGFILVSFFAIFMYYTYGLARSEGETLPPVMEDSPEHLDALKEMPTWKAVGLVVLGLLGLSIGGDWIVTGAVELSKTMGLSEAVIGIAIVGVGTSLPEVAASAMAAYKGKADIAIGNVVGSNLFNIFWVLGVSSLIRPIPYRIALNSDMFMTTLASVALFLAVFVGARRKIAWGEGVAFLAMYAVYLVWRIGFTDF